MHIDGVLVWSLIVSAMVRAILRGDVRSANRWHKISRCYSIWTRGIVDQYIATHPAELRFIVDLS